MTLWVAEIFSRRWIRRGSELQIGQRAEGICSVKTNSLEKAQNSIYNIKYYSICCCLSATLTIQVHKKLFLSSEEKGSVIGKHYVRPLCNELINEASLVCVVDYDKKSRITISFLDRFSYTEHLIFQL